MATIEMSTFTPKGGDTYEIVDAKARADLAAEQAKLSTVYENAGTYGFIEHMGTTAPGSRIEYVGLNAGYTPMTVDKTNHTTDYGSWSLWPTILQNKPYMVKALEKRIISLMKMTTQRKLLIRRILMWLTQIMTAALFQNLSRFIRRNG